MWTRLSDACFLVAMLGKYSVLMLQFDACTCKCSVHYMWMAIEKANLIVGVHNENKINHIVLYRALTEQLLNSLISYSFLRVQIEDMLRIHNSDTLINKPIS